MSISVVPNSGGGEDITETSQVGTDIATPGQVPVAQVDGSIQWEDQAGSGGASSYTITTKTGAYTVLDTELGDNNLFIFSVAATVVAGLPTLTAGLAGKSVRIANHSGSIGDVTVTAFAGDNIAGLSTYTLYSGDSAEFSPYNDSIYWIVL